MMVVHHFPKLPGSFSLSGLSTGSYALNNDNDYFAVFQVRVVSFSCLSSSMVIRDLTLRSAASFGSFHLIRLLFDEYMFYLVEHKVAIATSKTPIAIMSEVSVVPLIQKIHLFYAAYYVFLFYICMCALVLLSSLE